MLNRFGKQEAVMASFDAGPRIRRAGRFLKRSERNDSQLVEVGDFRINLETRNVRVRDRELSLSSEEFDLLVFLTAHPTSTVTTKTTLSTRCGNGRVRQVEMLRTLLSLRKKLQTTGDGSQYIRTEPWVFYRFEPEPFAK